jgi:hypothetical protein
VFAGWRLLQQALILPIFRRTVKLYFLARAFLPSFCDAPPPIRAQEAKAFAGIELYYVHK